MDDAGSYIAIQSWMIKELHLKSNELIIYALIHGFCQDGQSYFYGSIKYIMENTNLSKETVLSVLQSLVIKKLVIKKDVKSYQVFDTTRNAQGSQHFCLYYTTASRTTKKVAGQEIRPVNDEIHESKKLTGSKNLTRAGQEFVPVTGQEFVPNNLINNKFETANSTENKNTKKAEEDFSTDKIQEKLNALFGYNIKFNPSPFPKLVKNAKIVGIAEKSIFDYLEWSYCYLKKNCKDDEHFDGYFYKSFAEPNLIAKYCNISEQKQAVARKKSEQIFRCPVCGNMHNRDDLFCQECGLDSSLIENDNEIQKQKQIYSMPKLQKEEYESAIRRIENEHPLSVRFHDKNMQNEYEKKIKAVEIKFGLYEQYETAIPP